MALQGVVLFHAAAANSWRLFKGWKKKTNVSLGVFKKMQQSCLSDFSSLAVALYDFLYDLYAIKQS